MSNEDTRIRAQNMFMCCPFSSEELIKHMVVHSPEEFMCLVRAFKVRNASARSLKSINLTKEQSLKLFKMYIRNRVNAIKYAREEYNVGIKDAKTLVEQSFGLHAVEELPYRFLHGFRQTYEDQSSSEAILNLVHEIAAHYAVSSSFITEVASVGINKLEESIKCNF